MGENDTRLESINKGKGDRLNTKRILTLKKKKGDGDEVGGKADQSKVNAKITASYTRWSTKVLQGRGRNSLALVKKGAGGAERDQNFRYGEGEGGSTQRTRKEQNKPGSAARKEKGLKTRRESPKKNPRGNKKKKKERLYLNENGQKKSC